MEDYAQMSVNQRISLILKEMYGGNVTQMAVAFRTLAVCSATLTLSRHLGMPRY